MNKREIMEQDIKNFDRKIEQLMNEHSVTPPFGAWNRIAAELDAMPTVVAAAAESTSASAPNSSWRFFALAGTVLLAGITTAGLYFTSANKTTTQNLIPHGLSENTIPAIENKTQSTITLPITQIASSENKRNNNTIAEVKNENIKAIEPVIEQAKQAAASSFEKIDNKPSTVEATETEQGEMTLSMMFPAIDRNESVKFDQSTIDEEADEAKVKTKTTGSSYRTKFKKPKRQRFSYGHLNRVK